MRLMKIALAQLNYLIGDFSGNVAKIIEYISIARDQEADIICFGELAVCGYPPRDFLEFKDFITLAQQSINEIRLASEGIAVVVGAPTVNPIAEGKDLFNSVYFIADQEILHVQHKALLPTYDIFDEYRYFEPSSDFQIVNYKGQKIALTVCEDIWNIGNENPLYVTCPLDHLIQQKPDFVINVSASPFSFNHANARLDMLRANAERYKIPLFYVNHVGAQTEIIFDGGSVVMAANGMVHDEMDYFSEGMKCYELDKVKDTATNSEQPKDKIALIHDALVLGVQDYFGKLGFKKCVLGLSGGIDSAVTTVIAARALGPQNVRVLLMPSEFSSDHSVDDSIKLSDNLGIEYDIIKIKEVYDEYRLTLKPLFGDLPFNIAEENLQARVRGMLLMAVSNKFGHIVLNTSNKSEAAVGYGTLYGDMCGGLSVIGDLYKMEVYALANFMNKDGEVLPQHIITKPPSAELRPNQKDSDSLPDYDILDQVLKLYIEKRKGPVEIIALGFDPALVKRILRLVNINEFKRYQTAPALRVSSKAFGMGRRMPIVGKYLSR
ncbi:MAG: NAD+ synthase (glutamine-hydrolyzing) [Saprospiraceae bacterium]|jgi:NAD+ synthase (glutamine-hydrolysing)